MLGSKALRAPPPVSIHGGGRPAASMSCTRASVLARWRPTVCAVRRRRCSTVSEPRSARWPPIWGLRKLWEAAPPASQLQNTSQLVQRLQRATQLLTSLTDHQFAQFLDDGMRGAGHSRIGPRRRGNHAASRRRPRTGDHLEGRRPHHLLAPLARARPRLAHRHAAAARSGAA